MRKPTEEEVSQLRELVERGRYLGQICDLMGISVTLGRRWLAVTRSVAAGESTSCPVESSTALKERAPTTYYS